MHKKYTPHQANLSQFSLLTDSHAVVNKVYYPHSPLFSRKIVEIERFALWAAILCECQNDAMDK